MHDNDRNPLSIKYLGVQRLLTGSAPVTGMPGRTLQFATRGNAARDGCISMDVERRVRERAAEYWKAA
jgi:hypothetical protein